MPAFSGQVELTQAHPGRHNPRSSWPLRAARQPGAPGLASCHHNDHMPNTLQRWMAEVARLTGAGRLADVTRALQQSLGRHRPTSARASAPEANADVDAADATLAPASSRTRIPVGDEGTTLTGQHTFAGLTRRYQLYLPPSHGAHSPDAPRPLVVMLHGCTQDPADFALGTGMNTWARTLGFAVLYPEQPQEANPQRCWNWFQRGHQQRGHGEPAVLADMTRAVVVQHGLDADRVYVAGLSAGGAMAAILGQTYPDLYAAVGIHSGLTSGAADNLISALSVMKNGPKTPDAAPSPPPRPELASSDASDLHAAGNSRGPVPTIVFHGDLDAVVHPNNGFQAIAAALAGSPSLHDSERPATPSRQLGQSDGGHRYTRTIYPGGQQAPSQAEHWVIHGAGHAWSGGSAQGTHTDPSGPDASREMWRFFSEHTRAHPAQHPDSARCNSTG